MTGLKEDDDDDDFVDIGISEANNNNNEMSPPAGDKLPTASPALEENEQTAESSIEEISIAEESVEAVNEEAPVDISGKLCIYACLLFCLFVCRVCPIGDLFM